MVQQGIDEMEINSIDGVRIRPLRGPDCHIVAKFLTEMCREQQQNELRKQIKMMFLHPSMWVLSAFLIFTIGIGFSFPPIPTSCVVLLAVWFWCKLRFQYFWKKARLLFKVEGDDWYDLHKFYCLSRRKRLFLVAELGSHIVGTLAVREAPGMPDIAKTCKAWRFFVLPNWRWQGIGSMLLREAIIESSELGYERMSIQVTPNSEVEQLVVKNGFYLAETDIVASSYPLKLQNLDYERNDLQTRDIKPFRKNV
nr:uncharacterized protein LOC121119190 [Lepeophtheirus salmonis]